MWYDATSAAGSLEAKDSPVRGKIGYAAAPVVKTEAARAGSTPGRGASRQASTKQENAWKFVSWASGKEYEQLVGDTLGWSRVPAGKRASTYDNPDYLAEAARVRGPDQGRHRDRRPGQPGRAAPAGHSASSSSTSPSSPTSAPRSARTSARPSPGRPPSTRRWTRAKGSPRTSPSATRHGRKQ